MLPTIETGAGAAAMAAPTAPRRPEAAPEAASRAAAISSLYSSGWRTASQNAPIGAAQRGAQEAGGSEAVTKPASPTSRSTRIYGVRGRTDQTELGFTLSADEREAFIDAFVDRKSPAEMSPEEKDTIQKASERITNFVDETIARNNGKREQVEKAVGEWYSRISRGELDSSTDLINLLRLAATGDLDKLWEQAG